MKRAIDSNDVEVSADRRTRRYGNLQLEIIPVGQRTDLSLAIIEQAHMNQFPPLQLESNRSDAIGRKGFEQYYTSGTWQKYAPC